MASTRQGPAPPPPPPPASKTSGGEKSVFSSFINSHKALKPYASQIWTWANNYGGITPTQLAAVLWTESRGNPDALSSAGALGLAQIADTQAAEKNSAGVPFFRAQRAISDEDKRSPAFAIQYAAWRLSGAVKDAGGDIDAAWVAGYNPNYRVGVDGPENPVSRFLPKSYVGTPSQTSDQSSTRTVATQATTESLKAQTFDHWAVITRDGKVKFTKILDPSKPPANVLKYGPTPLTQTTFQQVWKQQYQDTFFAYTGRQASGKEVASILKNAPSLYSLSNTLASRVDVFKNSPTYKAHAPGIIGIAKQLYGEDWKPDRAFVAKAIAQNWDQATLETNLKSRSEYERGPAFKDAVAKATNVYTGIYGNPNPDVDVAMKELVKKGWTQDQVAAWLRSQPEYKNSQEYKSRALSFAQSLGLITGQTPTLTADQAMLGGPPRPPQTVTSNTGDTGIPLHVEGKFAPAKPVRPDDRAGVRGAY